MWWIIGLVIAGIFGIAQVILDSLRKEVAVERKRWEDSYQKAEEEVRSQQRLVEQQIREAQRVYDFKRLTDLHHASRKVADSTHGLLEGSRKTLAAMGRAIVTAAQERKKLEQRKRSAWLWEAGRLEKEIQSLHKLRDEILVPDKDRVKAQRDRLLAEVQKLNQQTGTLRDMIRDRCGPQGVAWYDALMQRTEIRQLNRERAREGLAPLPVPSTKPRQIETRVRGTVKWYDSRRDFGFITPDSGGQDVHVSRKSLRGVSSLQEGERVEFVIRESPKGPWAANVIRLK